MTTEAKRDEARHYRASMRRQGLRPLQIRVQDRGTPGFDEELQRQVRPVAESGQAKDDIAFVEALPAEWR